MKPFWKSKVVWFNAIVAAATVLWPYTQKLITPEEAGALVVAGNLFLRIFFTDQKLTLS